MYQLSFSNIFHQTNRFAPQGRFYNSCNSCSSICLTMHLKELTFVLGWGFVGVLMGLLLLFWCGFFCGFGGGGGGGVLVLFGFYISGFFSPQTLICLVWKSDLMVDSVLYVIWIYIYLFFFKVVSLLPLTIPLHWDRLKHYVIQHTQIAQQLHLWTLLVLYGKHHIVLVILFYLHFHEVLRFYVLFSF